MQDQSFIKLQELQENFNPEDFFNDLKKATGQLEDNDFPMHTVPVEKKWDSLSVYYYDVTIKVQVKDKYKIFKGIVCDKIETPFSEVKQKTLRVFYEHSKDMFDGNMRCKIVKMSRIVTEFYIAL